MKKSPWVACAVRAVARLLFLSLLLASVSPARAVEPKYLALTFDDGPSGRFTRKLLEGLEDRDAKVTFFLCGYRLEIYPELANAMLDQGHEIGLHGYSHKCMAKMDPSKLNQELEDTAALLTAQTGQDFSLLRPPGGLANQTVKQAAQAHGLTLVTWSVDPKDWDTNNQETVVHRVVERAQDGDIILLHDMSDSSVAAALEIIDTLTEQGYVFVTVSDLAALRGEALQAGVLYSEFRIKDDTSLR